METLIGLGLKSLLIAGATLGLLHLTRRRSAADRSWIAHLGLFALVTLPLASLALPALSIELPAAMQVETRAPLPAPIAVDFVDPPTVTAAPAIVDAAPAIDWTPFAYAVPALALLLVTLIALLRLFGLRGRAQVLVDPVWLSALAHAQRRMGFKNGTALLTSSELNSPISWGLMRPVILLNDEALAASGEAEAIIAHELAHVARLDWAKLMLARVATAIFWFNPLAWVLAREAHQLREEAADDAVLAADIRDTDYAQLLVGVARHECRGMLLGAHGISPGKGSLTRRVRRVLDSSLARASGGRSWVAGFAAGMLVMAAPLAALTFAPAAGDRLSDADVARAETPRATSSDVAIAEAADPIRLPAEVPRFVESVVRGAEGNLIDNKADGTTVVRSVNGSTITVHAPDAGGRRKLVMRSSSGAIMSFADARDAPGMGSLAFAEASRRAHPERRSDSAIDRAIEIKAVGVTPDYIAAIQRAAPQIGRLRIDDAVAMRAVGVTPRYIQDLAAAGFGNLDEDKLIEARAVGVTGAYVRSMRAAGVLGSLDDYVEMRSLGVDARDVSQARRLGPGAITAKKLVKIKTGDWESYGHASPEPPEPPDPPEPIELPEIDDAE